MTMRTRLALFVALLCIASPAFSQQPSAPRPRPAQAPTAEPAPAAGPAAAATPAPATVAVRPAREGQPINVKVEVTITDQRGSAAPVKKTLAAVVADQTSGSIRSTAMISNPTGGGGAVSLNLDSSPTILTDGKVRLSFSLQYDIPGVAAPSSAGATPTVTATNLRETFFVVLENGKSIVVTQSAEPVGDRQVTVEVKATILR
jgi:hypothetical protein